MKKFRYSWLALVIAAIFVVATACSSGEAAKEAPKKEMKKEMKKEKKEEKKMEAAAPKAPFGPADITMEDGTLSLEKGPAFTIDVPAAFKKKPANQWGPNDLLNVGKASPPFSLEVRVFMMDEENFDVFAKKSNEGWIPALKSMGSKQVDLLRSEKIDAYGGLAAYEAEVEWLWTDGSTVLTSIIHLIHKGDYVISFSGTTMGDPEGLTSIFETADMDP